MRKYQNLSHKKNSKTIASMFDLVAPAYDRMNRYMTLGTDTLWRKKLISLLESYSPHNLLDIATGTADLAIEMALNIPSIEKITAIDISQKMMDIGAEKVRRMNLSKLIEFQLENAEELSFKSSSFDCVSIAFGIRNFENISKALSEIYRVLNEAGVLIILELTVPENLYFYHIHKFYTSKLIPILSKLFSSNQCAYSYLPESIQLFPCRKKIIEMLLNAGFKTAFYHNLSFGSATIFIAIK